MLNVTAAKVIRLAVAVATVVLLILDAAHFASPMIAK